MECPTKVLRSVIVVKYENYKGKVLPGLGRLIYYIIMI